MSSPRCFCCGGTAEERKARRRNGFLRYFRSDHLPESLGRVSRRFEALAIDLCETLPESPELSVALRKLLEAKDCAVRAALDDAP